jgi:hypothetical protein
MCMKKILKKIFRQKNQLHIAKMIVQCKQRYTRTSLP